MTTFNQPCPMSVRSWVQSRTTYVIHKPLHSHRCAISAQHNYNERSVSSLLLNLLTNKMYTIWSELSMVTNNSMRKSFEVQWFKLVQNDIKHFLTAALYSIWMSNDKKLENIVKNVYMLQPICEISRFMKWLIFLAFSWND